MKVLHLCPNANFVEGSIKIFERFYPQRNIFLIFDVANTTEAVLAKKVVTTDADNVFHISPEEDKVLRIAEICRTHSIDNVVLHGLNPLFIPHIPHIKSYISGKIYWIFWGYELYSALGETGKYTLVDEKNPFKRETYLAPSPIKAFIRKLAGRSSYHDRLKTCLPYIDYFCFWFKYDYDLFVKFYPSNIQFKHFQYSARFQKDKFIEPVYGDNKKSKTIIINHQASLTGNHNTIFKKLSKMKGIDEYEIRVPLSYGNTYLKEEIIKHAKKRFANNLNIIDKYMERQVYYNYICSSEIAIFGQLRQEATGNILPLLTNGVKVFLRNNNPYLRFLRERSYYIYSFEDDLKGIDDLRPLTEEQRQHNREMTIKYRANYEDFMPFFFD